jgi:hypothetical protein
MKSRREFLRTGSIAFVALATLTRTSGTAAQGKDLPRLAENDPQAAALGYRHDARKVDAKKFPAYKPGTDCDDCLQYEGRKSEAWGPCKLFPGKAVNAKGWCAAFAPKKG